MLRLFYISCCIWVLEIWSFYAPKLKYYPNTGDSGQATFVTPFIQNGSILEGRKNCLVSPGYGGLKSYAGFFTVRTSFYYQSHLFFWFFPAEDGDIEVAPLLLMLQFGTGTSSLLGIFEGNGPYSIDPVSGSVLLGKCRLTQSFSVIYVDHIIGAGYSFTEDEVGYAYVKNEVSENLYIMMKQFFRLFPATKSASFHLMGESYSSSYIPRLAQMILFHNYQDGYNDTINLSGIALGSALLDPLNMVTNYSKAFYNLNLIDSVEWDEFATRDGKIYNLTKNQKYQEAFYEFDKLINGELTGTTFFKEMTGRSNLNFDNVDGLISNDNYYLQVSKFVQTSEFRRNVHVGNQTFFAQNNKVLKLMIGDILRPLPCSLDYLLKFHLKVLIYYGELDPLIPHSTVESFVKRMKWCNRLKYLNRTKRPYYVGGKIIGDVYPVGMFNEFMMLDAGHVISVDRPWETLRMIKSFVNRNLLLKDGFYVPVDAAALR